MIGEKSHDPKILASENDAISSIFIKVLHGRAIIITVLVCDAYNFLYNIFLILSIFRYEESKERNTKGYEERFLSYLEDIINQLDKRIERGYARLKRSASAKAEVLM